MRLIRTQNSWLTKVRDQGLFGSDVSMDKDTAIVIEGDVIAPQYLNARSNQHPVDSSQGSEFTLI